MRFRFESGRLHHGLGNATVTAVGVIAGVKVAGSDAIVVADVVASLKLVAGTPTP